MGGSLYIISYVFQKQPFNSIFTPVNIRRYIELVCVRKGVTYNASPGFSINPDLSVLRCKFLNAGHVPYTCLFTATSRRIDLKNLTFRQVF